jgi:hypothetical protein
MSRVYNVRTYEGADTDNNSFYCQICKYPIISREDISSNKSYKCCNDCYLTFIESRKQEWAKGWRPKQNKVDSYIETKNKLYQKTRRLL